MNWDKHCKRWLGRVYEPSVKGKKGKEHKVGYFDDEHMAGEAVKQHRVSLGLPEKAVRAKKVKEAAAAAAAIKADARAVAAAAEDVIVGLALAAARPASDDATNDVLPAKTANLSTAAAVKEIDIGVAMAEAMAVGTEVGRAL